MFEAHSTLSHTHTHTRISSDARNAGTHALTQFNDLADVRATYTLTFGVFNDRPCVLLFNADTSECLG